MKNNMTAFSILAVAMAFAFAGCQSGLSCHKELLSIDNELKLAFEVGDSAKFIANASKVADLIRCTGESEDLSEVQKGEAIAVQARSKEWLQQLPCRCYVLKIERVYEAMEENKEADEVTWEALYTRWEHVNDDAPFNWSETFNACSGNDAESLASMKAQVEVWNGYRTADEWMDDLESGFQKLKSTGEGLLNRLKEAAE